MATSALARRYAGAYFALARDAGGIPEWGQALRTVAGTLSAEAVRDSLTHPRYARAERAAMAAELLGGVLAPARNLAQLLVDRGRLPLLDEVVEEFDRLSDRASGMVRAEVVTAVHLDAGQQEQLTQTLSERLGGAVTVSVVEDPAILGGLVVRVGDRVIDLSVRTRLQKLQAAIA